MTPHALCYVLKSLGTIDVRCAVTGVVIRSEDAALFPLICTRPHSGWIIGLPRFGAHDGAGRLARMRKSVVFDAFAKSLVARARFPEAAPESTRFVQRLINLSETAAKLGMRELGFAFVLRSVYNALVSVGRTDATLIEQLRGKYRDAAGLFEVAVREHRTSQLLHEMVPPEAQKRLRIGLVTLARSGLGHGDLPRASLAAHVQNTREDIHAALDAARARWAHVPAVSVALSDYARGYD